MSKFDDIHKVLVLGSGAIKIGEAAEFDYSGSQCLKALREEGIETVLVNPNVATIQTDPRLAGKVYLLPLAAKYVERVIAREKPDGILLGFGGQTALNCGVQLKKKGILKKYDVEVLGTPVQTIENTEDRGVFRQTMIDADIPIPQSEPATSPQEAVQVAENLEYPVMVRGAYALGGKGSGVAENENELKELVKRALAQDMVSQVLVEEYLGHWKEVEYEVVRDYADNCLTICNMENIDPMGIHTGESIVVAPSQTLSNREYHLLRSASIKIIRSLGVIGECNIQWALDPKSEEFRVIEVNARLSRSSALASKATGYPLAYIATKLSLGYLLPELPNKVTGVTTACFEPALDYVVVKYPRWDLQKFQNVDRHIGTQMKSVGEVMGVGRCLEEALQKAVRMLDIGKVGLVCNSDSGSESQESIREALSNPTDERFFKIVHALREGFSIQEIYQLTGVDPFFLYKVENIVNLEEKLCSMNLDDKHLIPILERAKRLGFSDEQIAVCLQTDEMTIRKMRKEAGIVPVVKQIDTLAAEWPAQTNYLYLTYGGGEDDIDFTSEKSKVMVLGGGVFRIGSSVEFDWCGVNTIWSLKKHGIQEAIMVNYNPETVSTDYDMSDKLYFEELTLERILDICDKENPRGVIASVGGQIPNNLALKLSNNGVNILGTPAENIDGAENRSKFSTLLDQLGIPQPEWSELTRIEDAKRFGEKIGYPVLVRPSYVLSGSAMGVAYSAEELEGYLKRANQVSQEHPVVISKFMENAKEVEVDGVSDGEEVLIGAIIEHVEQAGVHSGDATMCIPPQTLSFDVLDSIKEYTPKIVKSLRIKGPYNIQYLVKDGITYVIECNLRSSRSMPYVSKSRGVNLIELATIAMLDKKFSDVGITELPPIKDVAVKVPQFSFFRLSGADPVLGVEMLSTGEVACLGEDFSDALYKALEAANFNIPPKEGSSVLITVGTDQLKQKVLPLGKRLRKIGFKIYATEHTAKALRNAGVDNVSVLHKVREVDKTPNIVDYLQEGKLDLVINIPMPTATEKYSEILKDQYRIRRLAIEFNTPVVTNLELASAFTKMLIEREEEEVTVFSLNEHMDNLEWNFW